MSLGLVLQWYTAAPQRTPHIQVRRHMIAATGARIIHTVGLELGGDVSSVDGSKNAYCFMTIANPEVSVAI